MMTQERFREIAVKKNWDLEKMRFFIGQRCTQAKCFGIYQDGDDWVVYKVKADGTFVEHFRGAEDPAFQEIYDKIISEINLRKAKYGGRTAPKSRHELIEENHSRRVLLKVLHTIIGVLVCAVILCLSIFYARYAYRHRDGYYMVDDTLYYTTSDDWYYYDEDNGDWYYDAYSDESWYDSYYGSSYDLGYGYAWEDSDWADTYNTENNDDYDDWDTDDWDTDDWDVDDTDWDSDW